MDKFNQIKLFIYDNRKRLIIIISLIFMFLLMTFLFLKKDKFKNEKIEYEEINNILVEEEEEEEEEDIIYYFVDIKGYVNNPGVYSLEKGKRVVDAINKAGGLKNDANTSLLNLSLEITDEMVIVVYSNSDITNLKKTLEEKEISEVICNETIVNEACICNSNTLVSGNINDSEDENSSIININKATLEELMTLPNIGESKAKAIIEYRNEVGSFQTIDDLLNVSGIGSKLFETIKEYITVE